jgi:hypothetical protein
MRFGNEAFRVQLPVPKLLLEYVHGENMETVWIRITAKEAQSHVGPWEGI